MAVLVLLLGLSAASAGDERRDQPAAPAEQYQALLKEFHGKAQGLYQAKTDEERKQVAAAVDALPRRFLELAEKDPGEATARDALVQAVTVEIWLENNTSHPGWGKDSPGCRAIAILMSHHLRSDKLGEACRRIAYGFRKECEDFLRAVLERNPHPDVQALACLRLAQFLNARLQRLELTKERLDSAKRYEGLFGKDYLEALQRQDRAQVARAVEALFTRAAEEYGDVKLPSGGTVGEKARSELYELRQLSVGREARDIEGLDQDGKRFKLSDYRGKVVLLYFWSEY